ncbi:hypothetical protein [Comamonas aquatica]|uniref:hypothetical protein n=1 Tax=Comamonas aquatica TaxID=225991 RepID=UPI0034D49B0F
MIFLSTGLANAVAGDVGLRGAMNGAFLNIYAGAVPVSADAAIGSATLLVTISVDGDGVTGLTFGAAANGEISRSAQESWMGNVVATGNPSFYRLVKSGDKGNASTSALRVQGTAGPSGDLLTRTTVTLGDPLHVDVYNLQLPTGA